MLAIASAASLFLYDALSLRVLSTLSGHVAPIKAISFSSNGILIISFCCRLVIFLLILSNLPEIIAADLSVFSVGLDGVACGFNLATGARIDEVSRLNGHVPFANGLVVSTPGASYGTAARKTDRARPSTPSLHGSPPVSPRSRIKAAKAAVRATLVSITTDGALKEVSWNFNPTSKVQDEDSVSVQESAALIPLDAAAGGGIVAVAAATARGRALITCLVKCRDAPYLLAGASNGNIHVYAWPLRFPRARLETEAEESQSVGGKSSSSGADGSPLSGLLPAHYEVGAHGCAVEQLCLSADDKLLFSGGADGSVMVFHLEDLIHQMDDSRGASATGTEKVGLTDGAADDKSVESAHEAAFSALSGASLAQLQADIDSDVFNLDVLQVSKEKLEESSREVAELRKKIEDIRNEGAFQIILKDNEWEHRLKTANEEAAANLDDLRSRYRTLEKAQADALEQHKISTARREEINASTIRELEAQYEYKLSLEMERYDRLSEEIEVIQQRCEGLLASSSADHSKKLRDQDSKARKADKELRSVVDRLAEDEKHNRTTFKEVLEQQESEYEAELMILMAAAQAELAAERSNTARMRVVVQERQATIDILKANLEELKVEATKQDELLAAHKQKNAKAEATLEHFKRHMVERESTLQEKEKGIMELRRQNATLDNFRFVLDNRVTQLVDERAPLAEHITGLEAHIDSMYEELEKEFSQKKITDQVFEAKTMKINTLTAELSVLRTSLREKEAYISSFKRELSGLMALQTPKDIEDGVKDCYQQFVKDEAPRRRVKASKMLRPGRDGLVDDSDQAQGKGVDSESRDMAQALHEAYSQRDHVEKIKDSLAKRLETTKKEAASVELRKVIIFCQLFLCFVALYNYLDYFSHSWKKMANS